MEGKLYDLFFKLNDAVLNEIDNDLFVEPEYALFDRFDSTAFNELKDCLFDKLDDALFGYSMVQHSMSLML